MTDAARIPPRYVPTLTEIVLPAQEPATEWMDMAPLEETPEPESFSSMQEQVIHRVMQRVDALVEQRLHEAIAAVVQQHTQALEPQLREEIELVIRQSVSEAVAEELAIGNASDM